MLWGHLPGASDVIVRPMTLDEVPAVLPLNLATQLVHVQAEPEVYRSFDAEGVNGVIAFMREKLRTGWIGLVAERDGALLGYVLAQHRVRPESPFTHACNTFYVDQIGVHPAERGSGLGRVLMEACEARAVALGCTRVHLHCRWANEGARGFYAALGYTLSQVELERKC